MQMISKFSSVYNLACGFRLACGFSLGGVSVSCSNISKTPFHFVFVSYCNPLPSGRVEWKEKKSPGLDKKKVYQKPTQLT